MKGKRCNGSTFSEFKWWGCLSHCTSDPGHRDCSPGVSYQTAGICGLQVRNTHICPPRWLPPRCPPMAFLGTCRAITSWWGLEELPHPAAPGWVQLQCSEMRSISPHSSAVNFQALFCWEGKYSSLSLMGTPPAGWEGAWAQCHSHFCSLKTPPCASMCS